MGVAPGFFGRETCSLPVTNARLMLPYLAFAGPVHGDDGLAQCAASFRDNRLLAAAFDVVLILGNPDALPVACGPAICRGW